jgi:hypothetical protein
MTKAAAMGRKGTRNFNELRATMSPERNLSMILRHLVVRI